MGFIGEQRTVESICRVVREQGCQVAAHLSGLAPIATALTINPGKVSNGQLLASA